MCEVADMLGISFGSVQSIFKDNQNMHQIATKFMLHLQSEEWEESLVNMC
jgi:hypothetical protein